MNRSVAERNNALFIDVGLPTPLLCNIFCRHVDNRLISCISPPPPDKATNGINHHRRRLNQRCGTASDTVNPSIFHLDVYCSLAARRCRKCGARACQASLLPDRTEQNGRCQTVPARRDLLITRRTPTLTPTQPCGRLAQRPQATANSSNLARSQYLATATDYFCRI